MNKVSAALTAESKLFPALTVAIENLWRYVVSNSSQLCWCWEGKRTEFCWQLLLK